MTVNVRISSTTEDYFKGAIRISVQSTDAEQIEIPVVGTFVANR